MKPREVQVLLGLLPLLSVWGSVPGAAAKRSDRTRWILVYAGGPKRPSYSVEDFRHLITAVDTSDHSTAWLSTGVIFLETTAASGRAFATWALHPPANGDDWAMYLDSLLQPGGALARLDSAISTAESVLGPLTHRFPVAIMIPYPDTSVDSLRFGSSWYSLRSLDGRTALAGKYISTVVERFRENRYRRLSLTGFYWLNERAFPPDQPLVKQIAVAVHRAGMKFLWIPYYRSAGHDLWKELGFDEAWYQPNYFFHLNVAPERVDSAMREAQTLRMGIELELDPRIVTDSAYEGRFTAYVDGLLRHSDLRNRSIAFYDGAGGLLELSRSRRSQDRARYADLVKALTGRNP